MILRGSTEKENEGRLDYLFARFILRRKRREGGPSFTSFQGNVEVPFLPLPLPLPLPLSFSLSICLSIFSSGVFPSVLFLAPSLHLPSYFPSSLHSNHESRIANSMSDLRSDSLSESMSDSMTDSSHKSSQVILLSQVSTSSTLKAPPLSLLQLPPPPPAPTFTYRHPLSWYPGHQSKSLRLLRESYLPKADLILEVRDSRLPLTSISPEFESLFQGPFASKPRLIIYNKSDLGNRNTRNGILEAIQRWTNKDLSISSSPSFSPSPPPHSLLQRLPLPLTSSSPSPFPTSSPPQTSSMLSPFPSSSSFLPPNLSLPLPVSDPLLDPGGPVKLGQIRTLNDQVSLIFTSLISGKGVSQILKFAQGKKKRSYSTEKRMV